MWEGGLWQSPCLPGKWGMNSLLCCLAWVALAFPVKLSASQPVSFLTLNPTFCPIPPLGSEGAAGGAQFPSGVKYSSSSP